jgi:hypothetical protein
MTITYSTTIILSILALSIHNSLYSSENPRLAAFREQVAQLQRERANNTSVIPPVNAAQIPQQGVPQGRFAQFQERVGQFRRDQAARAGTIEGETQQEAEQRGKELTRTQFQERSNQIRRERSQAGAIPVETPQEAEQRRTEQANTAMEEGLSRLRGNLGGKVNLAEIRDEAARQDRERFLSGPL